MNQPYIKEYDSNGMCTNPIRGTYATQAPTRNRRARRKPFNRGENRCLDYLQAVPNKPFVVRESRGVFEDANGTLRTHNKLFRNPEFTHIVKYIKHYKDASA